VVNFEGYLYQGWNCIMCVRFNNDETVSTPPTVRRRVASYFDGTKDEPFSNPSRDTSMNESSSPVSA
jgi:hypothetical protein